MNRTPSKSPEPAVPVVAVAQRRLSSMFRSLRSRDFALFWGGNFLSNIGTWMQNLALGWLILLMTNSPFLLGLNGFLSQAPSLFFSLPGGAIADRLNRRKLMLYTQTYMMLLALILAVLTSFKVIRINEILLISLLTGLASALNNPAYQALFPDLVEREDLLNAVALNSAQFNMSRAVGPMLAGLALGSLGAAWCFYLNSVSFLALIIALLIITLPRRESEGYDGVWEAMLEGLRFVRRNPVLIILLSVPAILSLLGLPFVVLMPAIARDMVHTGASGLGYLMAGAGLGAVVSALILAGLEDPAHKERLIMSSAALFSLGLILLATVHSFRWAFVLLVVLGVTMVGALALTNSTLQMSSPPALRGRVMSMYNLAVLGLAPVGSLQMGTVAEARGMRFALALGGSVSLVYFLVLLAFLPRLRRVAPLPRSGRPETAGR
ncbi:MAG: MFS transporter [Acidobacteria bacterium]|nr:MAG: MFS transporter [Acidobacteriota bacterium]